MPPNASPVPVLADIHGVEGGGNPQEPFRRYFFLAPDFFFAEDFLAAVFFFTGAFFLPP